MPVFRSHCIDVVITLTVFKQRIVTTAGDDPAVFDQTDLVDLFEYILGMGDQQDAFFGQVGKKGLIEPVPGLRIKTFGRLIQNPDRRVLQQPPGQYQTSRFTTGKMRSAFPDPGRSDPELWFPNCPDRRTRPLRIGQRCLAAAAPVCRENGP